MSDTTENGDSRVRSSNYPYFNLKRSVEYLHTLYEREALHQIPVDIAIEHLEMSPDSSIGKRAISSLTIFGLVEQERRGETRFVRISQLGRDIILSGLKAEGQKNPGLLKQAALKPKIVSHIVNKYCENGRLPSDKVLRLQLLDDTDVIVSKVAVDKVISVVKETLDYAEIGKDSIEETPTEEYAPPGEEVSLNKNGQEQESPPAKDAKDDERPPGFVSNTQVFRLRSGGEVILTIPHSVTDKEMELIKRWVDLMLEAIALPE
ncbi:MAG: hypothetical protein AB1791_02565 [Chloroflexota bacterium]